MAFTFGFFDSVNGDRKYNADDISNFFLKLISDGVFATPADAMQVQAGGGRSVHITAGWGFVQCKWFHNDSTYSLTPDAADILLGRIDRVVIRLNADSALRNMTLAVKKGTAAQNPEPPALTRVQGGTWELSLARIYIAENSTEITQADITDERADTSLCGWVTGLIDQIDTTNLFAQYNAAFTAWFGAVRNEVLRNTLVRQYTSRYETSAASEYSIPIGIDVFNFATDILHVFVNGMKLTEHRDYTLNTADSTVTLTDPLDVIGTPVEFEVLKSIDGSDAESIVTLVHQLDQTTIKSADIRRAAVLSKDAYEALTAYDAQTLYLIADESRA